MTVEPRKKILTILKKRTKILPNPNTTKERLNGEIPDC